MAGKRTTELTEAVSLSNEDMVYVVDQSASSNNKSKKIRVDNLKNTLVDLFVSFFAFFTTLFSIRFFTQAFLLEEL